MASRDVLARVMSLGKDQSRQDSDHFPLLLSVGASTSVDAQVSARGDESLCTSSRLS